MRGNVKELPLNVYADRSANPALIKSQIILVEVARKISMQEDYLP